MSIEQNGHLYTPTCDYCGDTLPAEFSFYEAVDAKKAANWQALKDEYGEWVDACPDCATGLYPGSTSAVNDFAGVGNK